MTRLWAVVPAVVLAVGATAVGSGAAIRAASGDTCTATGSGTSYTLSVTIPSGAPAQGGFAVGASGVILTNLTIQGDSGNRATTSLPQNTTLAEFAPRPLPTGIVTVNVQTADSYSGAFTVTPVDVPHTTFFDPISCALQTSSPTTPSNKFTARKTVTYNRATGVWRAFVTVPGPGKITFVHRTLAAGGTPKPLIHGGRVAIAQAGTVALTLRLSPAGAAVLQRAGVVKLNLNIEFSPRNGKPANKVLSLALRK
jgi:hypothetical protein